MGLSTVDTEKSIDVFISPLVLARLIFWGTNISQGDV